jgi:hypothetical protein
MAMFRLYVDGCLSVMKNQTIGRRGRRDAEERQQQRKAKCCVFLIFSASLRREVLFFFKKINTQPEYSLFSSDNYKAERSIRLLKIIDVDVFLTPSKSAI